MLPLIINNLESETYSLLLGQADYYKAFTINNSENKITVLTYLTLQRCATKMGLIMPEHQIYLIG